MINKISKNYNFKLISALNAHF